MWLVSVAVAAPIAFDTPETLPLFERAAVVSVKATAKDPDCVEAVAAAKKKVPKILASAGVDTVVGVFTGKGSLTPIDDVACKFTGPADNPYGAVASFRLLAVKPGSGPQVTAARTRELAFVLDATSDQDLEDLRIVEELGHPFVDFGVLELEREQNAGRKNVSGRASVALFDAVLPEARRWAALSAMKELRGGRVDVRVKTISVEGKKTKELFRFVVPSQAIGDLLGGKIEEPVFADLCQARHALDVKKKSWTDVRIDTLGTGSDAELRNRDAQIEDNLEGLEDE